MEAPSLAGIERRVSPRFDLMAQVRVKRGKIDLMMDLSNISMTGALVDMGTLRVPSWVQEGRVIEVGIVHPEELDTILVQAEIVRIQKTADGTKFGVRFVDVDDETRSGIERLHSASAMQSEHPQHEPPRPRSRKPPVPPPLPKTAG